MIPAFETGDPGKRNVPVIYLLKKDFNPSEYSIPSHEKKFIEELISSGLKENFEHIFFTINGRAHFLVPYKKSGKTEAYRNAGNKISKLLKSVKADKATLNSDVSDEQTLAFIEGLVLSFYTFDKYLSKKNNIGLERLYLGVKVDDQKLSKLRVLLEATFVARDLVNEPHSTLTAEVFSNELKRLGKIAGYSIEVFNKKKIETLKMGGLLAVNQGSVEPPTFNVLTWEPENSINDKPFILVGKGVTYDTGGMSLKPTPNSMDKMKSDMAGAAAVAGALYAISKAKIPIKVIGLIPATNNWPGENAVVPGDIIRMFDGTSVEVLNTDAEGRLILADALTYAKKYDPELVIDLATLTGAAQRAVGQYGIAMMENGAGKYNEGLKKAGFEVYERLVEFPLWEEYGAMLKSDVADMKNIGGATAGAITAGKFLEHFINYPWIHLDIAGTAFVDIEDGYRGKNATGSGTRLLFEFFQKIVETHE